MDKDLAALQEVRDQLQRARDARLIMEQASQADADRWAEAVAEAGRREAVRLAKMAVEETGYGHVTGKTLKNIFATEFSWKKFKSLKRHLMSHYGLTPEAYREKWGLEPSYPMVAPSYAAARSKLAKKMGLGRKAKR